MAEQYPPSSEYNESFPDESGTGVIGELVRRFSETSLANKAWIGAAGVALAALGISMKDQFDHGYKAWDKTVCYDWRDTPVGQGVPVTELTETVIDENRFTVSPVNASDISTIIMQANPHSFTNSPVDNSVITANKTIATPAICKTT